MTDFATDNRMIDLRERATNDRLGAAHQSRSTVSSGARRPPKNSAVPDQGAKIHSAPRPKEVTPGIKQSGKSLLLGVLNLVPFKPKSPVSTALLRHYVEGSGDPVSLDGFPQPWQDLVVKKTRGRPGHYRDVSSYDVGLYDMQNSLGHFDVDVKSMGGGEMLYSIHDEYKFGFKKGDRQARHGFPLGNLSDTSLSALRKLLPTDEYWNPGGFPERWEITRIGTENVLFIPQQFLAQEGVPFEVYASFRR